MEASLLITRKSSCVNARGIPTAAYQVLHLLTKVGYPPPSGYPHPGLMGVPGVPPCWGTPLSRSDGGYLGYPPVRVPPHPGLTGGYPWYPPSGHPPVGVPPCQGTLPHQGTPPGWTWFRYPPPGWTWLGYPPPPPRCGLTNKVKLLPPLSYYVRGR